MNDNMNMLAKWSLEDATITAVGYLGHVFNERNLNLEISEGRGETLVPVADEDDADSQDRNGMREVWDYQLSFWVKGGKEPEGGEQSESKIAIVGTLQDGRTCKIVGRGYIGRDNWGQIDGMFYRPPTIEIATAESQFVKYDKPK